MRLSTLPAALLSALVPAGALAFESGVRVTLQLPEQPTAEFLQDVVPNSEEAVKRLLAPDAEQESILIPETGRMAVRYTGTGWNPAFTLEQREVGLDLLRAVWEDNLKVEVKLPPVQVARFGQSIASQAPPLRKAVSLEVVEKDLRDALPSHLAKTGHRRFYDGGTALSGHGELVFVRNDKGEDIPVGTIPVIGRTPRIERKAPPVPGRTTTQERARQEYTISLPYEDAIVREAREAGVSPDTVRAVIAAKSGFDANKAARGGYGLMMVSHGAAIDVGMRGADLMDPDTNIRAGTRYLARMLKVFDGDLHRALAAYQAGPGTVLRSGGIPARRDVRNFLAQYQLAYRNSGPVKPAVKPVVAPRNPARRLLTDTAKSYVYKNPKHPTSKYRPLIEKYAGRYNVDPNLVHAVMMRENPWGQMHRVSPAGAVGLMQTLPSTARMYVDDPYDTEQNISAGVQHLRAMLRRFDDDVVLAVAAYNSGHVPVEKYGRIPNYRETVRYTTNVLIYYNELGGPKIDPTHHLTSRAQGWVRTRLALLQPRKVVA